MAPWEGLITLATLLVAAYGSQTKVAIQQHESGNSMIAKIIQMLGDEKKKIAKDIDAEGAEMDEYFNFCHREQDEKRYCIKKGNRKIDELSALIEDNTAQIAALDEQLVSMGSEMADFEASQKKMDERRATEKEEFKIREKEQTIMVDELTRLEVELEKQMESMQAIGKEPVLLQVEGSKRRVEGSSFWAQQVIQANDEIRQRVRAQIKAQMDANSNAEFQAEMQRHPAAMLQKDTEKGLSVEDLKSMTTGLAKSLSWLARDPRAARPVGVFVQEANAAVGNVDMTKEHLDATQQQNQKNLEAFQGLKEKAEKALQQERDNESEMAHQYMMDKQARVHEMNILSDKIDKAKEDRANYKEEMAKAEGEKAEAEATKEADIKYLEVLVTECEAASDAWAQRLQGAKDEQAAIGKAQEILSSRVKVFLQVGSHRQTVRVANPAVSDEQAAETTEARVRQTLMTHFRNLGSKLHSLSLLNMANAAAAQPLEKVKGMLKELIAKLEAEAAEAADTHAFCEEENKKNEKAKKTSQNKIDKVSLRLDKATTKKAELADAITTLVEEVAEIDASDVEATKIREEEHKTFVTNEADFKEAEAAVMEAMDVLKDFYGDDAFLFLQTGEQVDTTTKSPIAVQPPAMGAAKSDAGGGIIALLDTMASEFAQTVAELQTNERAAQKAYDKMKNENQVSKATKEAEVKGMESQVQMLAVNIGDHQDDLAMNQEEMQSILDYIEKLKPTCVGTVMPYEERKAKREAEIEGLKTALQILEDTGATLQSVSFLQARSQIDSA